MSCLIYQATVKQDDNNKEETYIGLTENKFKIRYGNHKHSFRQIALRNATSLSKHVWKLRDKGIPHSIKWRIITQSKAYSPSTKKCRLCTLEKYYIIFKPELCTLNDRNELASECKHRKKHLLCNA